MSIRHGCFHARPSRFVAEVRLDDGELRRVHVASSGRLTELLVPGASVIVKGDGKPGQQTAGLLSVVQHGKAWVSVDTALPGRLLRAALQARRLPAFAAYTEVRPEYQYGESRLDFLLQGQGEPPCLLEVKSVTLVLPDSDGVRVARFPDAPTGRGARHLDELARAVQQGYRAAACFVVQRQDADACGPHDQIDPHFGERLRAAAGAGVELCAWRLRVQPDRTEIDQEIPLRLGAY